MRFKVLQSCVLTLATMSASLNAATQTSEQSCTAFSGLFAAADEDPAFGSLSDRFASGSITASFEPDDHLGARPGSKCRLMNLRARGRVVACYFGADGYSDTSTRLGNGLAAKRHYTALLQDCGLLDGYKLNEDPDPITDIWTAADRSKTVTLEVTGIKPGSTSGLQFTLTAR